VANRSQQLHIRPPLPGQELRVGPVVSLRASTPRIDLRRVRYHYVEPHLFELPRNPMRVCARLQNDPAPLTSAEVPPDPFAARRDRRFCESSAVDIDLVDPAHPIAQIQPHRYLWKQLSTASHWPTSGFGASSPLMVNSWRPNIGDAVTSRGRPSHSNSAVDAVFLFSVFSAALW